MNYKRRAFVPPVIAAAAVGAYLTGLRPRLLRWGASPTETQRPLPGDDVVAHPRYVSTRAVTVRVMAADVWPWLVQMGQGRGGLYSYDWLENIVGCDIHSVSRIIPDLQHLAVGDAIRFVPEDSTVQVTMNVAIVKQNRALVLKTPDGPADMAEGLPFASWAFVLEDAAEGGTRLLVRFRSDYRPTLRGRLVNQYLLEPVHFVMERKMLLGIKARAEQRMRPGRQREQSAA